MFKCVVCKLVVLLDLRVNSCESTDRTPSGDLFSSDTELPVEVTILSLFLDLMDIYKKFRFSWFLSYETLFSKIESPLEDVRKEVS